MFQSNSWVSFCFFISCLVLFSHINIVQAEDDEFGQADVIESDLFESYFPEELPRQNLNATTASVNSPQQAIAKKIYHDRCVLVKGVASTEGVTEAFARQMAIRDALKNASMQNNLHITSSQEVEDYQLTKATERFTTQSKVRQYKIIHEGMQKHEEEDRYDQYGVEIKNFDQKVATTYEVEIKACLTEDPKACSQTPGNQYQLRLAIAQVAMSPNKTQSASDISNLLTGYQSELDRRLSLAGYQNKVMIQSGSEVFPNLNLQPNLSPDVLDPIRNQTGAQYLLLTVLNSASAHNENAKWINDFKRFYNKEVQPNKRYIEADWYLVDLMNHKIVDQQRGGFDVKGRVIVGRDKPFGTNAFFSTATGMVFHSLLKQQVAAVSTKLSCQPLETQIIDIRDGDYILFLSEDSGAQVGDSLSVYHKFGRNVRFQGVDLGTDSEPSGFLKIKRLHSRFAVAELDGRKGLIEVGDLVKAW